MWLFDLFRKKESVQPEPPNIVDVSEYRRPPVPRQRPFPHTNHRVVPVNARVAPLPGVSRNATGDSNDTSSSSDSSSSSYDSGSDSSSSSSDSGF